MAQQIKQNLEAKQELQLKLTPSLIQTVEILQMPLQELIERIEQEVTSNPFLEIENFEFKSLDVENTDSQADANILAELDENEGMIRKKGNDEEEERLLWETIKDEGEDLERKIMMQISILNVPEKTKTIITKIAGKVDMDGYLRISYEELLESIKKEMNQEISLEEVKDALNILKTKVEPKGIGSTTLKECLLAQIEPKHPRYELIHKIISDDIMNSKEFNIENLAVKYSCSVEEIKEALHTISRLNMYPFEGYIRDINRKIKPDGEIYYVDNELVVNVSTSYLPKLRLNKEYTKFLKDKKNSKFLREKYLSARKIIKDIQLRKMFLLKILQVIAQEQRDFFENGIVAMKALNLEMVSQKTGLSKSTISRIITNKYVQTPRGLFSIKFFLAPSPSRNTRVYYSKAAICDLIKELIAEENKQSPYTDSQLRLAIERKLNINLARRTITKFRLEMNIPSASIRKINYISAQSLPSPQKL